MFDIGFGELLMVFVIGLIVLGPQRLPVAVKTVVGWVRALRSLAATVQNELSQELKLQEFQDSLKKVEKASLNHLTPELKTSMDELRQAAESIKRTYTTHDREEAGNNEENAIQTKSTDVAPAEHTEQTQAPVAPPAPQTQTVSSPDGEVLTASAFPTTSGETAQTNEADSPSTSLTKPHADCGDAVKHLTDKNS